MELRDEQTITVLIDYNPKRPNTAAWHIWELYKSFNRVGAFIRAVRDSASTRRALGLRERPNSGREDLIWNIKHKFIRVD